jgi:formate transporter
MDSTTSNLSALSTVAYTPAEIEENTCKTGIKKAERAALPCFLLSVIAGGAIGLGAMFYLMVVSDPTLGFAAQRVLGGVVFSLGLAIVLIGGAELFTGNNLMVIAWADRKISSAQLLRNWGIVWAGNAVGAIGLVVIVMLADHTSMNHGLVGAASLKTAIGKVSLDGTTIFFRGILCNLMVCIAVWLAYGGKTVADKIIAMILPISGFVAGGFEHCVANMYFLTLGYLLKVTGHLPEGVDASALTLSSIFHNLVFATAGNIVGGSILVGGIYWLVFRKGLGRFAPEAAVRPGSIPH